MTSRPIQPGGEANPSVDAGLEQDFYNEQDFKKLLSDEYKILQDKIDKIGAFRFTIKGWSISAVIAASAAASGRSLLTVSVICGGLLLMLIFFFLLEYEQVLWSNLFGSRAGRIEDVFRRISRGKGREAFAEFPVPFTARELVLASHLRKSRRRRPQSPNPKKTSSTWAEKWHICRQAHVGFYGLLILMTFAPLFPYRVAIVGGLIELMKRLTHIVTWSR